MRDFLFRINECIKCGKLRFARNCAIIPYFVIYLSDRAELLAEELRASLCLYGYGVGV